MTFNLCQLTRTVSLARSHQGLTNRGGRRSEATSAFEQRSDQLFRVPEVLYAREALLLARESDACARAKRRGCAQEWKDTASLAFLLLASRRSGGWMALSLFPPQPPFFSSRVFFFSARAYTAERGARRKEEAASSRARKKKKRAKLASFRSTRKSDARNDRWLRARVERGPVRSSVKLSVLILSFYSLTRHAVQHEL